MWFENPPTPARDRARRGRRASDSRECPTRGLSSLVCAAILERVHHDLAPPRCGEDRQPAHDGGGDKVQRLGFLDSIPAAHGPDSARSSASQASAFPSATWERAKNNDVFRLFTQPRAWLGHLVICA